jgi:hypothetical protein
MAEDTLTFDQMMALFKEGEKQFKETREQFKETREQFKEAEKRQAEIDRLLKEKILETDRRMEESRLETERLLKERALETDRLIREMREESREANKRMKRFERQMGHVQNSVGALVESLVAAKIWERFPPGYKFERAYRNVQVYDGSNQIAEIDILLSNGDAVAAIEVKRKADVSDINYHVNTRMKRTFSFPPAEAKGKKIMAGVAFIEASSEARDLIAKNGMFSIEFNGKMVNVKEPPGREPATKW